MRDHDASEWVITMAGMRTLGARAVAGARVGVGAMMRLAAGTGEHDQQCERRGGAEQHGALIDNHERRAEVNREVS